jgi:hypothetical protein
MANTTYQYTLTQEEATIVEDIRAKVSKNTIPQSAEPSREELMKKYMDMDDNEFIDECSEAFDDDTILAVLQDTLSSTEKWDAIWSAFAEDVIDEMFESCVSNDVRRDLFLGTQDREELCVQLVDLTMDGKWTPEN